MIIEPGDNPLAMGDEEFSQLSAPPAAPAAVEGKDGAGEDDDANTNANADDDAGKGDEGKPKPSTDIVAKPDGDDGKNADGDEGDDDDAANKDGAGDKSKENGNLPQDKSQEQGKPAAKIVLDKDGKPVQSAKDGEQETPPDYQGFYEKMMTPLKANGKTIEIKTPEEAIQLMQMGANYTRKMQQLAPHRKMLLMLENHGLLDEGKLSFLIDINKKDPEAIKKLLKDSGIDPRDIDTAEDSTYREGNHRVSDEESVFRTTLGELSSDPDGRETLQLINTQWDQASKEILWKEPDVMTLIHQQRDSGVYDLITTELERQRALGQVPATTPFLHAYKKIGDELAEAGAFAHLGPKPVEKEPTSPVVTRKATPKPAVKNGDKASAASTTRTTSRNAETLVNPLALSDDDFMKKVAQFEGRM